MTHTRAAALLSGLVLGGCVDRQTALDPDEDLMPACMITQGYGHWNDGRHRALVNEHGSVGAACMCMTQDEFDEQVFFDELNELAFQECERIAAPHGFDWTDCQTAYASGEAVGGVWFARDELAYLNYEDLSCGADEAVDGCALMDAHHGVPWSLILVGVVLVRLRRRSVGEGPDARG